MMKFAAIALTSVLSVAGLSSAASAAADPYMTVGVPLAYGPGPYVCARGPWYWHHEFYGRGFYRDHFHYHGYYRR